MVHGYADKPDSFLPTIKCKATKLCFEVEQTSAIADIMAISVLMGSFKSLHTALNESSMTMSPDVFAAEASRYLAISHYALERSLEKGLTVQGNEMKLALARLTDNNEVFVACLRQKLNDTTKEILTSILETSKAEMKKDLLTLYDMMIDHPGIFNIQEWLLGKSKLLDDGGFIKYLVFCK